MPNSAPMQFSVVIPTYNRAALIGETIEAVLAQSLPAGEIIVVDDGSTDDTQSALQRFAGAINVIRICNSGDLVARNTGLRAARARLVAFCDSDDLWQPHLLARMSEFFERAPGLTAAYSDFRLLTGGELSCTTKFDEAPATFWHGACQVADGMLVYDAPIVDKLLDCQLLFPSCMTADRERFLHIGGWDEGVSRIVGCDFATVLRVGATKPLGLLHEPLVSIRKHASNFSGNVEAMNLGDARVLEYVLSRRQELAPLEAAIRDSVASRRRSAMASAFVRQDFGAVREIDRLIPRTHRPLAHRLKAAVATLPPPLAYLAANALSRLASRRARVVEHSH